MMKMRKIQVRSTLPHRTAPRVEPGKGTPGVVHPGKLPSGRRRGARVPRQERGAFLIALSVTIPLVAIALGAYAERSLRNLRGASRYQADAAALHLAKGGLEKALWMLSQDPGWREGFDATPVEGGTYTVTVEDDSAIPSLTGLVQIRAEGAVTSSQGISVEGITVMAATHVIRTVAGNGQGTFNGDGLLGTDTAVSRPHALAVDPGGNLWFTADSRIRRLDGATGIVTTPVGTGYGSLAAGDALGDGGPAALARFMDPRGISFSPDGTALFIADAGNGLIREVNLGPAPLPIFGFGGVGIPLMPGNIDKIAGDWPLGYSGDGSFAYTARFGPDLNGAVVDSSGLVFVSDASNNRLRVINTGFAMAAVGTTLILPGFMDTVYGNGTIGYGLDGVPGTAVGMSGPGPVTFDAAGDIWVPLEGHGEVYRLQRATGIIWHVAGEKFSSIPLDGDPALTAGLGGPRGLALFPDGSWVVSSGSFHTVRLIDGSGVIDTIAGQSFTPGFRGEYGPACVALANSPVGVAAPPASDGDFYFSDQENHRIRKVSREILVYNYTEG